MRERQTSVDTRHDHSRRARRQKFMQPRKASALELGPPKR